jgi:hypothetical protein
LRPNSWNFRLFCLPDAARLRLADDRRGDARRSRQTVTYLRTIVSEAAPAPQGGGAIALEPASA